MDDTEKERSGVFRDHGLDRFEGVSPDDLFDEFYDPRSDAQLSINPERITIVRDMVGRLSIEAKEVLRIVVDTPAELAAYVRDSGKARMSRPIIKDYLRYCDWTFHNIGDAFREVRDFLKKIS
jgi:hypothetical protein